MGYRTAVPSTFVTTPLIGTVTISAWLGTSNAEHDEREDDRRFIARFLEANGLGMDDNQNSRH